MWKPVWQLKCRALSLVVSNISHSRTHGAHAGLLFPLTFSSLDVWICVVSPLLFHHCSIPPTCPALSSASHLILVSVFIMQMSPSFMVDREGHAIEMKAQAPHISHVQYVHIKQWMPIISAWQLHSLEDYDTSEYECKVLQIVQCAHSAQCRRKCFVSCFVGYTDCKMRY